VVLYLRSVRPNGLPWPGWVAVRALARRSMPLVVAGLGNQINLRADVVMIQAFLATESVGIYAVASRLSELAYFLPVLVMNSTLPLLLQVRNGGGREQYTRLLQSAYARAFWSGCALTVLVWSFGPTLIDWLFGAVYAPSADVLRIHILAAPFVFMGAVYTKWIIAEEYLWSSFLRHGLGAGLNVVLNLLLIPEFGLKGAAWATVASYVVANYLAALVGRSTREQGLRMTWAILAPFRAGYRLLRHRA
jgi:O-antigen/teichoic acid export membrane protein